MQLRVEAAAQARFAGAGGLRRHVLPSIRTSSRRWRNYRQKPNVSPEKLCGS
jgi:hypothetical protein